MEGTVTKARTAAGSRFWTRVVAHLEPEISEYRAMIKDAKDSEQWTLWGSLEDCYDDYADESVRIMEEERWLQMCRGERVERVGYMGGLGADPPFDPQVPSKLV